jgi:hypothetical protein
MILFVFGEKVTPNWWVLPLLKQKDLRVGKQKQALITHSPLRCRDRGVNTNREWCSKLIRKLPERAELGIGIRRLVLLAQ